MQLFKRVLLSLFPDEITTNNINPASMFVSFISAKEFFTVINKKIVENYKLNLFDVNLDPFEFKIGFGNNYAIKTKEIDTYYGYSATANINGYRFFNAANTSTNISLIASIYIKKTFRKYDDKYFLYILYTIFLLSFVFSAKIKVFPYTEEQKNYNWFVDVFFNFYALVFEQTKQKIDPKIFKEIKNDIIKQVDIMYMLFIYYKQLNESFDESYSNEFYRWLLQNETEDTKLKYKIEQYIKEVKSFNTKNDFSGTEKAIIQLILPADILLKYIFHENNMFLVTDNIISKVFDTKEVDKLIKNIRKNPKQLENFILYITDYRLFKKNFFEGVQKYILNTFRKKEEEDPELQEELDDLMSSIGDGDIENLDSFKIPEKIKQESKMMEKILNFYVTLIGGYWIGRGDSNFVRVFRKKLLNKILDRTDIVDEKKDTLHYYGSLFYLYNKNVFYYKYATDNIRAGKQKFYLPYKSELKKSKLNMYIIQMFNQSFLATILQDINPKDIRIYIQNKEILNLFKDKFGKSISKLVQKDSKEFLHDVYYPLERITQIEGLTKIINKYLEKSDIYQIKENIYNLDFWLSNELYKHIINKDINLNKGLSDISIIGILATLRETLLGFMLFIKYLDQKDQAHDMNINIDILFKVYCKDLLNINGITAKQLTNVIKDISKEFDEILELWLSTDDNNDYLKVGLESRLRFIDKKDYIDITNSIVGEDVLWFKGYLKNITYYNKRFLIPK